MKLKEIILDFTPLLDVIMIILFWFILNYHNQTVDMQNQAKEMMANAESIVAEQNEREEELNEKEAEIDRLLTEINESDESKGANISALNEYQQGINLKAELRRKGDAFELSFYKGDEISNDSAMCTVNISDFTAEKFGEILSECGYSAGDGILFDLIYDNEEKGSYRVISDIDAIIDETRQNYKYLYYGKLKISNMRDE